MRRKIVLIFFVSSLLLSLAFLQKGNIPTVKASPDIYQGDLILSGNNVTVIEDQFDINGSIIVEENATLILRNAVVNFTQKEWKQFNITFRNPFNGNPRLLVSFATIISTPDFQFEVYFYGNSTAQISHLYVHNKIIAYETSWLNITDSPHIWYIDCRDSSSANITNSEIWYVKPFDAASISVKDSDLTMAMENYGTSTSSVSNTTMGFLGTYSSSITALSNCSISNMRPQGGSSSSLTVFDCNIDNFDVSTSCSIFMSNCAISSFEAQGISNVTLSDCSVIGMYAHSSSVVTVFNELVTNGSIIVEENAALILRNALLNFIQTTNNQFNLTLRNPANGNPRIVAYNSTIDSNADLRLILKGNSTADLNKATIPWRVSCRAEDVSILSISNSSNINTLFAESGSSAHIVVQNSTIHQWQNYGYNKAPEAQVYDSVIDNLLFGSSSINCTISGLHPGLVTYWNFIENCSVAFSGDLGGAAPNITLTNTQVGLWRFAFYSSSNVVTIDSVVQASAYGEARIQVFWYLDVHVQDDINQDVPSANVTATYPNATLAESKLTGGDGWIRLTLMEKIKNATGEYPVGIYTVEATYETCSNTTPVEMTGTQQITLTLEGFIIPEFPSLLITSLFMTSILLAAIVYKRKCSQ